MSETAVGSETSDDETGVVFRGEGGGGIGAGDVGRDVIAYFESASAVDARGEGAVRFEVGKVEDLGGVEAAFGEEEVVRVSCVDAGLVVRIGSSPRVEIVSVVDAVRDEGSLVARIHVADGLDHGLRPHFALVEPERSAEDGRAFALVDVHELMGIEFSTTPGDQEGHSPEVECETTVTHVDPDSIAFHVQVQLVDAGGKYEPGGVLEASLFIVKVLKLRPEGAVCRGREGCRTRWDCIGWLGSFYVSTVDWKASFVCIVC